MNILFLSHLSGASYAGPTYSVPKQIEAQAKIDNVFWYNACISQKNEWKELSYYHDITDYPGESIYDLPSPFDKPDVIVVEGFYNMTNSKLRKELVKDKYPYVIIPRGELTKQAQKRKSLKKKIANLFFCNSFAHNARAIQYLTEQEYKDSGDKWNSNHIIVPNGIDLPYKTKVSFSNDGIKCISIGRLEPYQKGLDLLIKACAEIQSELQKANCTIKICGPDSEGKLSELKKLVSDNGLEKIVSFGNPLYGEDKESALLDSDVFLMTSRFEGHPMALIEAISYGLPCLVTQGSNMSQLIYENKSGWSAENNIESIQSAMISMLSSIEQFECYSHNSRNVAKYFEWQVISNRQHDLYLDLL